MTAMPQPEPGLTSAKVEELIQAAIADQPKPNPGVTADEVRRLAQYTVATVPSKSVPAEHTKFFVNNAISRYESDGLAATLAYYNRPESIDDQWYVFIVDEDGGVISHFNAHVLGENLNGPLGTDANGYNFGPDMLSATGRAGGCPTCTGIPKQGPSAPISARCSSRTPGWCGTTGCCSAPACATTNLATDITHVPCRPPKAGQQ